MLASSVSLFHDNSSYGPNQIALLLAAGVASVIGLYLGETWKDMERAMADGIALALKACLILLAVGSLIGSWMLAGTAPTVIYFGLGILDPAWFYPAALIICALVAISIGSSWTTAGTIGLALMGISQIMGLSAPVTAGAVISGAYFGDKMSPLSDTTNLAPAMVGVDLFVHIRHMAWTTVPSFLISLVLFSLIGWNSETVQAPAESINAARDILRDNYTIAWPTVLPLALLLVLAMRKVSALPTIAAGALAGCIVALIWQPELVQAFGSPDGELSAFAASVMALFTALADGFQIDTGNESLDSLLSRGGMSSMLNTIWLIMSAMCFGGVMEHTGLLQRIVDALLKGVRGTGSLVTTTVLTSIGMNIIAADQYIAIVLPGRMYRLEFARRGLAPQNLSRTLEDAGTMTSALVPWNTCGAFMAATLGVPTLAYAPYAFVNLLNPVIAIIYGVTNFRIIPLEQEAGAEPSAT
ncbi:MAG: Na+/H+ antiporter NhaC [Xanthomonadales bacterium]|nr:Na+/H+ antiporter NhaC [Gammaproteobacteria bacterium]MBT8053494.1 Na+/H+ antiporter NhaC [Gammaproteobacteria bacterium]NND55862.1 Na+/H+ antiporter NhaC [Xanthomonadales bacterium]NNK50918.1 Na+/H+ antiporter NhaC [Xanthomonadales bacterium]